MSDDAGLGVEGSGERRTSLASRLALAVSVIALIVVAVLVWMNDAAGGGDEASPEDSVVSSVAEAVWAGVPELPSGEELPPSRPVAVWLEEGVRFAVVTMGSSSCPPVATSLDREGDGHVSLEFSPSPHAECTADMAPTTHEFLVPSGVGQRPVRLRIVDVESGSERVLTLG